ncbi:hypothetical protein OB2597_07375 [Pseudooceanicola batsensis HTCC2597]|uniref:Ribosomal RNA small subunit methyltransferase I n=1 Tax=Pseudooceanicola batsensis (strain ATCC BAA-863 / DSM 15984 / KCTC 12145 / HTCC2597) TaxID=252305 RepID=A3TTW0_PSEBH|nr:16S rRNA (cytidine(1402)-2'-O)-methyltransferase [Pseudooceanicola batsensis]EAQ05087.1 hypothetical protein OB2597_07375 [Pseudooceanicola batsensis HTCC2597]
MNPQTGKPAPGLTLVSVPIGTARDITLRALDVLREADVLAAEDTRSLRKLLDIHGIALGDRPLVAYHDHNGDRVRPRLLAALEQGLSVAYASEAGTPMIADPGFDLARAAREAGHAVTAAPGVSAVVTALSLGGLPTDRFLFAGFLPSQAKARRDGLRALEAVPATLVFYESPRRLGRMLADAAEALGGAREAAVCRELTKRFEEIRRGSLEELAAAYADLAPKGEIVVLIGRKKAGDVSEKFVIGRIEEELSAGRTVRDSATSVAGETGWPRRRVYQLALELAKGGD